MSSRIEPDYLAAFNTLTDTEKKLETFLVYDQLGKNLLLFCPPNRMFVYSASEELNYRAWSHWEVPEFRCACTTILGRVFFAIGTKIFQHGNIAYGQKFYADLLKDRDTTWVNSGVFTAGMKVLDSVTGDVYTCLVTHIAPSIGTFAEDRTSSPGRWALYEGEEIDFDFELPWFQGRDPMQVKKLKFAQVESNGSAQFTLKAYVDGLYKDHDGNELWQPSLSLLMHGGQALGYGSPGDPPYGTGRHSNDPRLNRFGVKFKKIKFRVTGSTRLPLEIVNFSFLFSRGKYIRG